MSKNTLTPAEEQIRKNRVRTRLFVILVVFDILCLAYLVYEMISIFVLKKPS